MRRIFHKSYIELVKLNVFLISRIKLDSKLNVMWKILHSYIYALLNIKRAHTHKIVDVFNLTVVTHRQIKNGIFEKL